MQVVASKLRLFEVSCGQVMCDEAAPGIGDSWGEEYGDFEVIGDGDIALRPSLICG